MSEHSMKADGRRRQWLAVDAQYTSSKLALGLRERFGALGVLVFDLFLRSCKRSHIQGEITYNSDADFLNIIGMPGLDLRNETGVPWTLDEFFTYLGQQKNTRRTHSGRLTNVRSTRWERWENTRSSRRNVGPMPDENETGMRADKTRHDTENDNDNDAADDEVAIADAVWTEYARRRYELQPAGGIRHPTRWIQATARAAREEQWIRAQHLLRHFELTERQLVDVLLSETSPQWLAHCSRDRAAGDN
jgi:hypothetical protein